MALGSLCYVLVDTTVSGDMFACDNSIIAMYHHANFEADLPKRYSEGVLLLHRQTDVEDTVVVASLMRVLGHVRHAGKRQPRMGRLRRAWSRLR